VSLQRALRAPCSRQPKEHTITTSTHRPGSGLDDPWGDIPLEPRLTAAAIRARGFGWRYRGQARPALQDLEFDLAPGDLLVVLGPTGSGRTTLGRALAGIVPHRLGGKWQGELSVDALDVARSSVRYIARSVGLVSDDVVRWPLMASVASEIAFGLENRAVPSTLIGEAVERALTAFGLDGEQRVETLSAGARRRLGLAVAFAARPPLLVLDGPTDHLDPRARDDLLALLRETSRRRDQTVVLIDRRATELLDIADRVLLLGEAGDQQYYGPPAALDRGRALGIEGAGAWLPGQWATLPTLTEAGAHVEPALPAQLPGLREPLLVVHDLGVQVTDPTGRVRRQLVAGFHLVLRAGQRVALVGDNAAGATTTIRALAGEISVRRGSVLIGDGRDRPELDPRSVPAARRRQLLGVVHETSPLVPLSTSVAGEVSGGRRDIRRDETLWADLTETLARFAPHLPPAGDPRHLSGGAARLAQLCALLWAAPGIALLDQPEVGIDRRGWELLVGLLDELRRLGQAQLVATHDELLIGRCDTVIELRDGQPTTAVGAS